MALDFRWGVNHCFDYVGLGHRHHTAPAPRLFANPSTPSIVATANNLNNISSAETTTPPNHGNTRSHIQCSRQIYTWSLWTV